MAASPTGLSISSSAPPAERAVLQQGIAPARNHDGRQFARRACICSSRSIPLMTGICRSSSRHALPLGRYRDKRVKQTAGHFWRNPGPGVRYDDFCSAIAYGRGGNLEFTPRHLLHRFDAVADEVDDDLLDLDFIDEDRAEGRIEHNERSSHSHPPNTRRPS